MAELRYAPEITVYKKVRTYEPFAARTPAAEGPRTETRYVGEVVLMNGATEKHVIVGTDAKELAHEVAIDVIESVPGVKASGRACSLIFKVDKQSVAVEGLEVKRLPLDGGEIADFSEGFTSEFRHG